jgi:hypothetical protein
MRRLLQEPLLHFLVLGAALFGAYGWLGDRSGDDAGSAGEIVVTQGRIRSLAEGFGRTWNRPPTDDELAGLVRSYLREEVMTREALALGLDRDDTIVRRRMALKMEFLFEDLTGALTPTDDQLADYLAQHADSFRAEARVSFSQVFLDPRKRGDALEADAEGLLAQLDAAGELSDLAVLGDSAMLEPRLEDAPQSEVAAQFGEQFARALLELPADRWVGPVASGYGAHLVRVEKREPARLPDLEEVRDAVTREWTTARRGELKEAQLDALLAKYKVTIEEAESTGGSVGSGDDRVADGRT